MQLRDASISDAQILFDWRNDPVTRQNSVSTAPVDWHGHIEWLTKRLASESPGLFIAVETIPVGTIRIDGDEISYTVAPEQRGRGVATAMLTLARARFGEKQAKIKVDNVASITAATRAGHRVDIIPATQSEAKTN